MARSSAAKSAMNRWGSSVDSSEIAASRMAAAQPSVRSQRASISASVSSSATSPSMSRVSSTVIASSAALISTSCPERRYRSSGIGGSDLVERTMRS